MHTDGWGAPRNSNPTHAHHNAHRRRIGTTTTPRAPPPPPPWRRHVSRRRRVHERARITTRLQSGWVKITQQRECRPQQQQQQQRGDGDEDAPTPQWRFEARCTEDGGRGGTSSTHKLRATPPNREGGRGRHGARGYRSIVLMKPQKDERSRCAHHCPSPLHVELKLLWRNTPTRVRSDAQGGAAHHRCCCRRFCSGFWYSVLH